MYLASPLMALTANRAPAHCVAVQSPRICGTSAARFPRGFNWDRSPSTAGSAPTISAANARNAIFARFARRVTYRAIGVVLAKRPKEGSAQLDLFDEVVRTERVRRIYDAVDALSEKFGKHTVYLVTSLKALTTPSHSGDRNVVAVRQQDLFRGEPKRKRLAVPMLGEAS